MIETENDILSADDAAILLYVAGELGESDRLALEARLKADSRLQAKLEEMTAFDGLMRTDSSARPVDAADSRLALANSLRLVREQALILQSRPLRMPRRRLGGVPRWAWGTAIAASVAVGALVWITNTDPAPIKANPDLRADRNDMAPFPTRGDVAAFASGFLPVQAEGTETASYEISSQLDALETLAVMDEPLGDVSDATSDSSLTP